MPGIFLFPALYFVYSGFILSKQRGKQKGEFRSERRFD